MLSYAWVARCTGPRLWRGSGLSQLDLPVQFHNFDNRWKGAPSRPFASELAWLLGAMAWLPPLRRQFMVLFITTWCFIDEGYVSDIEVAFTVWSYCPAQFSSAALRHSGPGVGRRPSSSLSPSPTRRACSTWGVEITCGPITTSAVV